MGSSWRYHHVAIPPFSVGYFSRARKLKTTGSHQSKQKNKSAQSAPHTFEQHFSTQVSPHYPQLEPIYNDEGRNSPSKLMTSHCALHHRSRDEHRQASDQHSRWSCSVAHYSSTLLSSQHSGWPPTWSCVIKTVWLIEINKSLSSFKPD